MNQAQYEREVDARAREMLEATAERGAHSLWTAHALLALGREADFVDIVRRGLRVDGERISGGPFEVLPAMLLLRRWESRLPEEAVALLRRFMVRGVLERGNTENHWLMYYTGNLLGAERWADEPVFWNGRPPSMMRAEATRWILGTIGRTAMLGHHEYDSPGYHVEHMTPMVGLFEHTQDAELRRQVEQALALFVADMALEYFRGAWAGGHSREGYRQNTWTYTGPVQALQYLYFGGEAFDPDRHVQGFAVPVLVAGYRPPALFAELAHDRSRPHAVRKTKAPRNVYRHVDREAEPVRKYTYMSRSFALGSTQVGLPGAPAGPIDLVSWDLTWDGPRHQAKIVCNHPYRSPGRFSAFLCGLPQAIGRAIGSDKPYLQWPDRLFGASPYERMMQHEGTIVVLYRVPEMDEAGFVNLYLPKGLAWVERAGWLFADAGGFYVGLRPIGVYGWEEIREGSASNILVTETDLINGWLLRIGDRNAGLVLEAVEADEVAGFGAFCDRRTALGVDLSGWPDGGRVGVETVRGARMEMVYDGPHRVNGGVVDYGAWPLYEAPGVWAHPGTGVMRFERGDAEVRLDFGLDPQAPLLPMRVIG